MAQKRAIYFKVFWRIFIHIYSQISTLQNGKRKIKTYLTKDVTCYEALVQERNLDNFRWLLDEIPSRGLNYRNFPKIEFSKNLNFPPFSVVSIRNHEFC